MGLLKLFKKPKLTQSSNSASNGRVLKELSELDLFYTDRTVLESLYKNIMSINNQNNRLQILEYLTKLLFDIPLTPINHPLKTSEFICHTELKLQSSRCKSLWSHDGGDFWYDIDNDTRTHRIYRWIYKNIFRSSKYTPKFIESRMMPYVNFPYTKNIK